MPRQMRVQSRTKIYHVMIRGNEKRNLFLDDEDRRKFLDLLREKNKEHKYAIYAYCLMENHVHLVINEGEDEISRIMKRINTSYAYYFNNKYHRVGHVFQDRFRSEAIEREKYLLAVVRYIHNNPVKAGVVANLAEYHWSSFNDYIDDNIDNLQIIDSDTVLGIFSFNRESAVKELIEFHKQNDEYRFIDNPNELDDTKEIANEPEARNYIEAFLKDKTDSTDLSILRSDIRLRNELIRQLMEKSALSIRQIANLLNINRGMVERSKT
ncbi:MAG: transposase [Dehalobacterium sp.]